MAHNPSPASAQPKQLPTISERLAQLGSIESKLPDIPDLVPLSELSSKTDALWPTSDVRVNTVDEFLIDISGFYDVIGATYDSIVEMGKGSSLLSCHEFALVCFWYFYKRLSDIRDSAGCPRAELAYSRNIGHDELPAPIWNYLSGLGKVIGPNGKIYIPAFPYPNFGYLSGLFPSWTQAQDADDILAGPQLAFLRNAINVAANNPRATKNQLYDLQLGVLPNTFSRAIYCWDFSFPATSRSLGEVHLDFIDQRDGFCFNPSILNSYRSFHSATKTKYVFKRFSDMTTAGSPSQSMMFSRHCTFGSIHHTASAPVELSKEDCTMGILFRYRCIHAKSATVLRNQDKLYCLQLCPRMLGPPFGLRGNSRYEVLSQVKDYCSYFCILGSRRDG